MVLRITFFALMALGLLGLGVIAFSATHPAHPAHVAAAKPVTVSILVATRSVRAGALLKPEDLGNKVIPIPDRHPGDSLDTAADRRSLVGAMVRRSLSKGEPVRADALLRPGDHGFLAAVLKPGMRAVTVGVDDDHRHRGADLAGRPGRPDPYRRPSTMPTSPPGQRVAAETVLSDVRVIAIDQQLVKVRLPAKAPRPRTPSPWK